MYAIRSYYGNFERAAFWSGLRPATPSNVPYIGRTRYRNLWLNTGHGTLGWTLGAGSGFRIADMIAAGYRAQSAQSDSIPPTPGMVSTNRMTFSAMIPQVT